MHKAAAARNWQGYGHKNHLGLRTCDWTQGFKPGSLQRAREHSHAYTNETPETSHPRLDAESQAIADNAHEAPCAESHTVTAPKLGTAEPAKHRLRRQPSTTHSCTLHHSSCNSRMTYCTLSFVDRSRNLEKTLASLRLKASSNPGMTASARMLCNGSRKTVASCMRPSVLSSIIGSKPYR